MCSSYSKSTLEISASTKIQEKKAYALERKKNNTVDFILRQNDYLHRKSQKSTKKAISTDSKLSKVTGYKDNIQNAIAYQYTSHGVNN